MVNKKIIFLFLAIPLFLSALIVFRHWLAFGVISAGDLGFFYPVNIKEYWQRPLSWESFRNSGLGGYAVPFQHFYFFNLLWGVLGHFFGFALVERIVWFWPIIFLGFLDAYLLASFCGLGITWSPLVWLVLILNTYFLMVVSGGQITVVFGYLLFLLIFVLFLKAVSDTKARLSKIIYFSLGLVFLVVLDPRFAYLFFLAAFSYFLFDLILGGLKPASIFKLITRYFKVFVPAGLITLVIHFYWLLPLVLFRRPILPVGYEKADWAKFLSFANFSDALSLLHPNWPENIFGKTYFFRPEFLILPILAFSSLLFINKLTSSRVKELKNSLINNSLITNKTILYFSLLGLIGAFLAKGVKPPFGFVYYWLFNHLPGMSMFRDPLKFYTFVALSYAVLIPFSFSRIYRLIKSRTKSFFPEALLIISVGVLLFLVKPVFIGEIGGTFKTKEVPEQYFLLKNFLEDQKEFFRILWVPKRQRFGFYSNNHPAIDSESFVTDFLCHEPLCSLKTEMPENWGRVCLPSERCYVRELSYMLNSQAIKVFSQLGVKYIIVPLDSEGEIFIAEHHYNPQQRQEVEEFLDSIPWLKKIKLADQIAVYELPESQDHFFINDLTTGEAKLTGWQMVNPTKYLVSLEIDQPPATLVFSETYDQLWQAKSAGEIITSSPALNYLNSFQINHSGKLELIVEHAAQKAVNYGLIISILGIFLSGLLLR